MVTFEPLTQLLLAVLCGFLVGFEREKYKKPAGVRTCALVCLGSALFSILSVLITNGVSVADPGRIASNIVQGIGFLGAGTILTVRNKVVGLTTAAVIWAVAAIGMAIGFKLYLLGITAALLTTVVVWGVGWLERKYWMHHHSQE